jgi:hypothetical protein
MVSSPLKEPVVLRFLARVLETTLPTKTGTDATGFAMNPDLAESILKKRSGR